MEKVLNTKRLFFDPSLRPVTPPERRVDSSGDRNEEIAPRGKTSRTFRCRSGIPAPSSSCPSFLDNQVLDRKRGPFPARTGERTASATNSKPKPQKIKPLAAAVRSRRARTAAAGAGLLIALVSLMAICIQIKSFFWEKNRTLVIDGDPVYERLLLEDAERGTIQADPGRAADFVLPTLTVRSYTVRKGDSLFGIARRFDISVDTLISANHITNAYYLQAGTRLEVPSRSGIYHEVKRGDNLSVLARQYGVVVNEIADVNDLSSELLKIGQVLFMPGAALSSWERALALGELFTKPLSGRITSGMGFRRDPFTGLRAWHAGLDIASPKGTPVQAAQQGTVVYAGYKGNYGRVVEISHPNGYRTVYGHLSRVTVKRGQVVRQGQNIGNVGSTGRSTGPHLHLEIHRYGKILDPMKLIHW